MHPLLDPFTGSRDAAIEACVSYVRSMHPVGARFATRWRGGVGVQLAVLFAWFETARELGRSDSKFVHQRGFDLLRATLDDALLGGPHAGGALDRALPHALDAADASPVSLMGCLEEHERGLAVGAFASRTELLTHAARLTHPEAMAYLGVLGATDERARFEARALAEGLQLVRWLVDAQSELRAGRLRFAADDVARFRVDLDSLIRGSGTEATRALAASHAAWAGGLLAKGWSLTSTLGWARGRALASLLRWNVAELAALEARDFAPGAPPPAGWMRRVACGASALATRRPAAW